MPTDKQRAANKRNAQKSTGPRTEEGKKTSSANAVRHGLFSRDFALSEEERIEHRRLLDGYLDHFRPEDPIALDLVEELAMAKMRQKRAWAIEADLLRIEHFRQRKSHEQDFSHEGPAGRLALCEEWLGDQAQAVDKIRRYEGQLQRAWHRCLDKLDRRKNEPKRLQPQCIQSPVNRDREGAATFTSKNAAPGEQASARDLPDTEPEGHPNTVEPRLVRNNYRFPLTPITDCNMLITDCDKER